MSDIPFFPSSTASLWYEPKSRSALKDSDQSLARKEKKDMSQRVNSNGADWRESQLDDSSVDASCGVLELAYPLVDPAMLLPKKSEVTATGPHVVLTCGPYDEDEEDD
jgi:hypothetical protein